MAMKSRLIKYCPRYKKEITVTKDGNRRGKQCYLCKECGGTKQCQFVDRKYPIEVRSLAASLFFSGYPYRAVAGIFGIAPNTARNWVKAETTYKIPYKTQIKILKSYKLQCYKMKLLNDKIIQLNKALKYKQYTEQIKDLQKVYLKCYEKKRLAIRQELNRIDDEIKNLGEIKHKNHSVRDIRKLLSETAEKLKKQNEIKSEIETQSVFARNNYDIDKIIDLMEKLLNKETAA